MSQPDWSVIERALKQSLFLIQREIVDADNVMELEAEKNIKAALEELEQLKCANTATPS